MQDIHPIKPAIQLSIFTQTQITIFWIIVFLLVCTLTYFIYKKYFLNRPKKIKPQITETDFKTQALNKLKQAKRNIELNKLKKFHLKVTDIIKEYVYKQYAVNFPQMTTKEILSHSGFKQIEKEKLKDFLKQCDLVKFANQKSRKELAEDIYKTGVEIINEL